MRVALIPLVAFVVAALVTQWLRPLSLRFGMVDRKNSNRERNGKPMPLVGGLGILAGLAAGMLVSPTLGPDARQQFIALIIAALPVVMVGLMEDFGHTSHLARLAAHILAALVLVGLGNVNLLNIGDLFGLERDIILEFWGAPLAVVCIVGMIKAMNKLDGTDGLAGGVALIALAWYGLVASIQGLLFQGLLALASIGAVVGFLIFNARTRFRRRASVSLGYTGSTLLGLLLVWLAITLTQQPSSTFPAAMSAWILAVPLIETLGVMAARMASLKTPFKSYQNHLQQRILRPALSERRVVAILLFSSFLYGAIGVGAWKLRLPQVGMFIGAFVVLAAYLLAIRWRHLVVSWIRRHTLRPGRDEPKVIFVNKYFYPDISATSQLLSNLAFHLSARDYNVRVVASRQCYDSGERVLAPHETVRGVQVFRVWTSSFGRQDLLLRVLDYLSFYCFACLRVATIARAVDVIVVKTDPPLLSVPMAVVARLCGAQLVNWMQDVYPEVGERLGVLPTHGILWRSLRRLRLHALRRASVNVVLGQRMRKQVGEIVGTRETHLAVVQNWVDGTAIHPIDNSPLKAEWGLQGKFVVEYSGNMGRVHEFETILLACMLLNNELDIVFLFVGGGHRKGYTRERVAALSLRNVVFHDYQPANRLADSLSVADVHLAVLLPEMEGLVVPSKFYGIAAAGRPTVFVGDLDGEVPRLLTKFGIGLTVRAGDAALLAQVLKNLRDDPPNRFEMGRRARAVFEKEWDQPIAMAEWEKILDRVEVSSNADAGAGNQGGYKPPA